MRLKYLNKRNKEDGSEEATMLTDIYQDLKQFKEHIDSDQIEVIVSLLRGLAKKPLGIYEKKALLKLVLAKMSDYIVQVRVKKIFKNRPPSFKARGGVESSMFWVPPDQKENFYNETTGFISESDQAFVW